jgi:hypothetical protein
MEEQSRITISRLGQAAIIGSVITLVRTPREKLGSHIYDLSDGD